MSRFAELCFPVPLNRSFTYLIPEGMPVCAGMKVRAPFGRRMSAAWVIEVHDRDPGTSFALKAIDKVMVKDSLFGADTLDLARWVAAWNHAGLGEALEAMLPGAIRSRDMDEDAFEVGEAEGGRQGPLELSAEQQAAIDGIRAMDHGLCYLYGATGSGKTEVFLRVAESVMGKGRSVIYLVPEISLTRQVIDDIKARFGERAAVLHSRLTPSQRLGEWRRIQTGEARLAVGARSAVFAPMRELGLIILDEEHEGSYKSSSSPRYHARQVAMHRSSSEKAVLLMGSATPSVEAWHLMAEGRITRFHLPHRVSGGRMPTVTIHGLKGGNALGPELVEAMQRTAAEGLQTILFLNRRGFSHFSFCQSCGSEVKCLHCSVPMTYHKSRDRLVCHYCGRVQAPPRTCPSCKAPAMAYAGFGTEFVEEEARKLFPHLRIERLDTDSVRKKGQLEDILSAFRKGEIDILLGTQMVAKGLNFPRLKLVGVVLGDSGLHMPDFRAAERTFNLLVQVAGRAGRYRDDGMVLIQAAQPEHRVVQLAAALDAEAFYTEEIQTRMALGFPPASRLIRLVFRSREEARARDAAKAFATAHGPALGALGEVMGPAECPLLQVNGSYRFHMLLSSARMGPLQAALGAALANWKDPNGTYLEVDVDPVAML